MKTITPLTDEQVEQFRRDGFVILESLFSTEEVEALRAEARRILELVVNASIALRENHPRADFRVSPDGSIKMRKVQPVNDLSEIVASVSSDPRLIEPMRELMDDDPVLMEEKLNFKQVIPCERKRLDFLDSTYPKDHFALHHDWGYYRQQGYPSNTLSSAVALDDCAGRGPLRVLPGSHLIDAPLIDPDPAHGQGLVVESQFADVPRLSVELTAGSAIIFHSKLLHDSEPNDSGLPRRLMIYSHYPKSHDGGADADRRNRWLRDLSEPFHARYRAKVDAGEYADVFRAPAD